MGGLFQAARAAQAEAGSQTMSGGNVPEPSEEEPAPEPVKTATFEGRESNVAETAPTSLPSNEALAKFNLTFPGDDQVKRSKAYDQSYGSPSAGFFKSGNAKIETISIDMAQKFYDAKQAPYGPLTLTDADMSEKLHKAWLGSQRSAVASLGFNLMRTVMSPEENKTAEVAGFYAPSRWGHRRPGESPDHPWVAERQMQNEDRMWFDAKFPAALVHESIHRGLGILKANRLLFSVDADGKRKDIDLNKMITNEYGIRFSTDELLTRAFMMKFFGNIELSQEGINEDNIPEDVKRKDSLEAQVLAAQKYIKKEDLDTIEKAASTLFYELQRPPAGPDGMPRPPRGPR